MRRRNRSSASRSPSLRTSIRSAWCCTSCSAGRRPYKLQRDSRGALEEAILQADPPLPSAVAEPGCRKALRGDLDTVVLKALKKKPAERYPTVHALLEDIERHLSSRPVLAQRDSRWYRTKKFIARNTLAVSAAAAIAVALIGGTVVAGWQARIALAEKARAEEVQAFIASVFREADPMMQREGKALSAVELLLQAERRMNERKDATPELRWKCSPSSARACSACRTTRNPRASSKTRCACSSQSRMRIR